MSQIRIPSNARDEEGNTDLMRAALDGEIEIVKTLLRDGADVNARNHEGRTALMFAIINFHNATVNVLLRFGADVKDGGIRFQDLGRSGHPAAAIGERGQAVGAVRRLRTGDPGIELFRGERSECADGFTGRRIDGRDHTS